MNVGVLSSALPYLPARDGFRIYAANIVRALARRHRVDLVALVGGDDEAHLQWARLHCASVTTLPTGRASVPRRVANLACSYLLGRPLHYRRAVQAAIRSLAVTRRWDVLHVEGGFMGGLVPPDLGIPLVLSVHDSWTLRCDEMLRLSTSVSEKLYYLMLRSHELRYQRLAFSRFRSCVVVAPRDAEALKATLPHTNIAVIPSGVDTEYFRPVELPRRGARLVFHGNLGYGPNVDAALTFAEDIFPRVKRDVPEATFCLVGADPSPEVQALAVRPGISLMANLPDLREAVGSADVYVCAMRHGTGVKNKILEAMAMGVPIVCSPAAASGIDCRAGEHILIADDPSTFASCVVDLLRAPVRAAAMAQAARAFVQSEYSWDSRARMFESLYDAAPSEPGRHTAAVNPGLTVR